jgi:hypothetical protein
VSFRLLQRQQMLLKHRVVQIEPDLWVRLRHHRAASRCHPDQHLPDHG